MSIMLENNGQSDELLMENASTLEVKEDGIEISSLFDPPQTLPGVRVSRIDFLNGKVFLSKN